MLVRAQEVVRADATDAWTSSGQDARALFSWPPHLVALHSSRSSWKSSGTTCTAPLASSRADGRYPRDRVEQQIKPLLGLTAEMRSISLLLLTGRFRGARLNSLHSEKELPQLGQYGRISFRQTSDDRVASSHDLFQLLLERITRGLVDVLA
jgi:hypothetical protein